ncbi:MAG: MFS transporter [Methanomassiliicoccales archaeon]|nr:MAG: MFS transporter [Methanomassiliicoccales archaeon]
MFKDKLKGLSKFPRVFWVSQTFEILERGAYYSMMPIIVVHAIWNVGLPIWLGAMITAFMYPFQYGLPIFTGALAERVGYKRQITFAFIVLTLAYLFLAFAFNTITMILAVITVGIGIGSYKPLISATVAKCTSSEDRNLAYAIYYWFVNLAAFLIPFIFVIVIFLGAIQRSTYHVIFICGACLVSINIITALFIFEEVPRSGEVKTVGDAVNNIKMAMKDKKFVVMVILIGGFWMLYSSFLNALPLILFGFRRLPGWFDVMLLGVFNPFTIIALGIFLARYIEKVESMRVVLTGIMIYLIGLAIIGYSLQWVLVIFGIVIASIGEFIVAPGYMAFVSKLAVKEKVSAYVGCNFISYMIGLLGGTFVFSLIVNYVGVELEMPHFFYGILLAFGLGLLITFVIYYWTWGQDIIERAKKIKEMEEGTDEKSETPSDYKEPIIFQIFDNKLSVIVCAILIPIVLFSTFSMGTLTFYPPEEEEEELPAFNVEDYNIIDGTSFGFSGTLSEGGSASETITIYIGEGEYLEEGEFLKSIRFELSWEDEPDQNVGPFGLISLENQPDEFLMSVAEGENFTKEDTGTNPHGGEGRIEITFNFDHDTIESINGTGEWEVEVTLDYCGDFEDPTGLYTEVDNSNSYNLVAITEIYTPK